MTKTVSIPCATLSAIRFSSRFKRTVFTIHSTEYGRCGNNCFDGSSGRVRAIEAEGAYVADRVITVSGPLAVDSE